MAGLDVAKGLFIVVTMISILFKTAFWQSSIQVHLLVTISWRSEKDKITFKAIEKFIMVSEKKLCRNTFTGNHNHHEWARGGHLCCGV